MSAQTFEVTSSPIAALIPGNAALLTGVEREDDGALRLYIGARYHAVVLAWGAEMEARAHAHLAENGLPPVAWIRCVEPLDAVQRVVLWERIRLARKARIPASRMSQEITRYGNDPTFHGVDWETEWALCRLAEKAVAA